jgi:hypothetical protein
MGRDPEVIQDELVPLHHLYCRALYSARHKFAIRSRPCCRLGWRLADRCGTLGVAGPGIAVGEAGYGCGGYQQNGCEYEQKFLHGVSPFEKKLKSKVSVVLCTLPRAIGRERLALQVFGKSKLLELRGASEDLSDKVRLWR